MDLTVLAVPGYPNAPVLRERLAAVVEGRAGVPQRSGLVWRFAVSAMLIDNTPGIACRP